MARRELGPAALEVVQALRAALTPGSGGPRGLLRIGCSGGPDSLALSAGVAHLITRGELDGPVQVMIVDHGLQPDSAQVAERAAAQLRDRGLPVRIEAVAVTGTGQGPEAAARRARYRALLAADPGLGVPELVLLGHTREDQAEQVLLGLARGSGVRSLAGMAPVSPSDSPPTLLVRPLLGLARACTEAACREWGLAAWVDPHNSEPRFLRSRIRTEVMPVLSEVLGPGVVEALARTAELARLDADELDARAQAALQEITASSDPMSLPVAPLEGLPAALRIRVIRRWLGGQGVHGLDLERSRAVWALVADWHGQAGIDLPGGRRVVRRDGQLRLGPA